MSKIDAGAQTAPYAYRGEAATLPAEPQIEHTVNTGGRVNRRPRLATVRGPERWKLLLNGNAFCGEFPVLPTRTD